MNVEQFEMDKYPEQNDNGEPVTGHWKIAFKDKDGRIKFHQVHYGTTTNSKVPKIANQDILDFEKEFKSPALLVLFGCEHYQEEPQGEWKDVNLFKEAPKIFYEGSYTEAFWNTWRPEAYSGKTKDIFKFSKPHKDNSEVEKLRNDMAEKERALKTSKNNESIMQEEIKRLKAELLEKKNVTSN